MGKLDLAIPGVYMICGLQGGGKSHLIKYMMHENRDKFDVGIVFSNTGADEGNFEYIDKRFVHKKYDSAVLTNIRNLFDEQKKNGKKLCGFVIFDDCLARKQWNDDELIALATQVRHCNITLIISTQYPTAIPPLFRNNTWKSFMFFMPNKGAIKALYENYGAMYGTLEEFTEAYKDATTPNYQFMVFDALNGGRDVESRYKVMICPKDIPKFTVGKHK